MAQFNVPSESQRFSAVVETFRGVDLNNSPSNLMEDAANKTEGVASAVVNFMTQKMIVEFAEGADAKDVMKDVLKACKKVEPDCEIEL